MNKLYRFAAFYKFAAVAVLATLGSSSALAADKPAATTPTTQTKNGAVVNGITIPQSRIELRVKDLISKGQVDSPELRKAVRDELINLEIMAQEAVKKGFDKNEETVSQLDMAKQSILVGAFVQDYFKNHPISEDDLKKEYEELKKSAGGKEYKARHILVKEEAEAKSISAQLKKGAKFDALASKHSLDPGSKEKGGALDWAMPANFVKPFSDALVALKKGGVSAPVQSEFGWHIIKLEDVREFKFPAYREVKQNLMQRSQQQAIQKAVADMRTAAKIE